ncbi:hypothetical protein Enr10x_13500 [Gimesia panareensis]|uniref:Uncharacterized protein n=1 Tax=Gimesia panareensis TaxID=2527978 RepID=A0A517Q356_9PLAN|nr:hypothetical protein [Gimesia panareensis]QDT26052.1 hypothetical protein Enr10x_13500 [Gimesia panareensis]
MLELKRFASCAMFIVLSGMFLVTGSTAPVMGEECDQPGVAAYAAVQFGETVSVIAHGVHPTSGFQNCLQEGPEDIFPPIFDFKIKKPTGVILPKITPFTASDDFESQQQIEEISVRDAKGMHKVKVVQISVGKQTGDNSTGKRLQLDSTYQTTPIDFGVGPGKGARGITLIGMIADQETIILSLDPNTCSLNEFGDRDGCTKMALTNLKVKLSQLRLADPLKLGRQIYRIESNQFPKSLVVYLIVPKSESGYRLKVENPKSDDIVVPLEINPAVSKK